jgi:ribosomal protein S21
MSVRIEVREGEQIVAALRRLHAQIRHAYRRQWHKTRPGAYEKPSYRRRKRETLRNRNARLAGTAFRRSPEVRATVNLSLGLMYSREEAYQRKRAPFRSSRRWWNEE